MADDAEAPVDTTEKSFIEKFMFKYWPLCGCISYQGFSLYIAAPLLFKKYCGRYDIMVSNSLWFNAHIGMALYLFSSKHMMAATTWKRISFTTFSVIMFNFGSVLLWATTKSSLSRYPNIHTTGCLASALGLLFLGRSYVTHIDSKV